MSLTFTPSEKRRARPARAGAGSLSAMRDQGRDADAVREKRGARIGLAGGRREKMQDWAATILCAVLVLSGAMIGNVTYGKVGLWAGELIGLLLGVAISWRWLRGRPGKR